MSVADLLPLRETLTEHGLMAKKSFGQHFLRDRGVLARIADALNLEDGTTVIEIGPGRGALTDVLAERAARLLAIEVDRDLAAHLRERYADIQQSSLDFLRELLELARLHHAGDHAVDATGCGR